MAKTQKTAVIFGGTGFVGKQIVGQLADQGITVKVATRIPESAYFLKPLGNVGQIVPVMFLHDEKAVSQLIKGADYVINCVGILYERGRSKFHRAHVELPEMIAKACKKHNVSRFVHISALGIEESHSKYAASKLEGEHAIWRHFKKATILRPSVIFGEDDNFFNMFAHLARFLPVLPLIGGGQTKFQPVFVGDVADAVMKAIKDAKTQGKIYELGGPETLTFKELYQKMFSYTGRPRALVPVPFFFAKFQAVFMSLLPTPLLTPDQVESLKTHTIVSESAHGFEDLGLKPTALDLVLPSYLESYRAGGRFAA